MASAAANYEEDGFELIDDDHHNRSDDLDDECLVDDDDDDHDVDDEDAGMSGDAKLQRRGGRKKLKLANEKSRRSVGRRSLGAGSRGVAAGLVTLSQQPPQRVGVVADQQTSEAKKQLGVKIDRVCEYALVLMHCVLYKINYYNRKTHFDKTIKYNIVVYKCKSEIVCEYISNCIECMRLLLYDKYQLDASGTTSESNQRRTTNEDDTFSIGLAVLKSSGEEEDVASGNILIKRYTLQIECLVSSLSDESSSVDEWNFRDSLLKCLYSKDVQYPKNFKWQIQIRTHKSSIQKMSSREDLFKLFAWRHCDNQEVTSIKSKSSSAYNRLSIKPIKTMTHLGKLRIQLFIEQSIQSNNNNKR